MGRWSPECWKCTWLDGATGPAVGARFKGYNKRGVMRWSTVSTIVVADEPSHIVWEVDESGMRWGYRITADGAGRTSPSTVRRSVRSRGGSESVYASRLLGRDPDAIVRKGMSETLARLKTGAETP